jgi:ribonuclease P protein component
MWDARAHPPTVPEKRNTYPKSHRLGGRLQFAAVFDAKVKESRGPLTIYSLPSELGHSRLGISISRRVGTAVRRNRIKRLLREAFRLNQSDMARGYDLVIVVRPHETLPLADYEKLLTALVQRSDAVWARRRRA